MKSGEAELTIGEVADRFGLGTHVLRHWETMGLLTPRRVSGRRRYGEDDLYRVAAFLHGKHAGLSLEQIYQMFTVTNPSGRTGILRDQRDVVRRRIAAAQQQLDLIECVLRCRHSDFTQCPTYRALLGLRIAVGDPSPEHAAAHG
ncbi:MerR family transcriptional regulator [Kribbella capetownensis]|uniref:MerR family transcriptional regulator n=1 Tax=Kribbella capetownensis TaxID=1572659 RepID=A0A4V2M7F3_9ACTN|nr:MerR family transcriptional regulator [Kribbella capetownensis]TCC47432.1 MerR family transcriptional regulator [Kribbella capetownensis]